MTNTEKQRINALPFIPFKPSEAIEYWEYKEEQERTRKPLSFDNEPLESEPFFHGLPDVIIQYRRHLITALGGKQYDGMWRLYKNINRQGGISHSFTDLQEEFITTASDKAFFDKIEDYIF